MYNVLTRVVGLLAVVLYSVAVCAQSTEPAGTVSPPVSIVGGQPATVTPGDQSAPSSASQPTLYIRAKIQDGLRIGGGDLLHVSVFGASDYTHDLRVADDGTISLPLIGEVRVAGLTPREVASDLQVRLSQGGYFNHPEVEVFVKEYATQGVSVLGEVQKPGIYPLLGSRTLFDVLSAAQGTTQTAGDKVYITHRDRPQQPEIVKISYDVKGAAQSNVPVLPGDTIIVPKAGMVYVVGNVQKPTGIVMVDSGLTVLKAIALAQGIAPNAALDRARLVRKTSDGQTAIPLKLKQMLAAKEPDMPLQPDDVIFVPNSLAASGFKRGLELALQTASGVLIYHHN